MQFLVLTTYANLFNEAADVAKTGASGASKSADGTTPIVNTAAKAPDAAKPPTSRTSRFIEDLPEAHADPYKRLDIWAQQQDPVGAAAKAADDAKKLADIAGTATVVERKKTLRDVLRSTRENLLQFIRNPGKYIQMSKQLQTAWNEFKNLDTYKGNWAKLTSAIKAIFKRLTNRKPKPNKETRSDNGKQDEDLMNFD